MSKLSDFLNKNKIDPRRVLVASADLERLLPEDRYTRLVKDRVRKGKASDAEKEAAARKGRSGKPVAKPTLDKAMKGEAVSGPAKTRITRAVNHVLATKKREPVTTRDLF